MGDGEEHSDALKILVVLLGVLVGEVIIYCLVIYVNENYVIPQKVKPVVSQLIKTAQIFQFFTPDHSKCGGDSPKNGGNACDKCGKLLSTSSEAETTPKPESKFSETTNLETEKLLSTAVSDTSRDTSSTFMDSGVGFGFNVKT